MSKLVRCLLCSLMICLQGCRTVTKQTISQVANGPFKVMIRTREYSHSGSYVVDLCVASSGDPQFPEHPGRTSQCFLNGYDFTDLSVRWRGPSVIEVSFDSGIVAHFTNSALASASGSTPVSFHTVLCDGCDPARSGEK